jgi:hypothetical protein
MNSLKSDCSFAKSAPVAFHELEKEVEPLFGRQVRIELIVGCVRIIEAAKYSSNSVHRQKLYHAP